MNKKNGNEKMELKERKKDRKEEMAGFDRRNLMARTFLTGIRFMRDTKKDAKRLKKNS